MLTEENTSFSSLVGIGSKRQVDGLDEVISEVNSILSVEKQSKASGLTAISRYLVLQDKSVLTARAGGD